MQIVRYINGTEIQGEMPKLEIENPVTVQILLSVQERLLASPEWRKKE